MTTASSVRVGSCQIGAHLPFTLVAGPCVVESLDHALMTASRLTEITQKLGIPFIYKSSFDKANRTSSESFRGLGLEKVLSIFSAIKEKIGCPILTDIHEPEQGVLMADVVDVLQIPAFLCRQTNLLQAAAATGKVLNIKKGQFLAPWDMEHVLHKVTCTGHHSFMLCERGSCFGYNNLVVDFRSLEIMRDFGYPVLFDATHAVQQPGGKGAASGGERRYVAPLARAALAVGVAGLFMETHEDPDHAPSDGPNMVPLEQMPSLLEEFKALDAFVKGRNTHEHDHTRLRP